MASVESVADEARGASDVDHLDAAPPSRPRPFDDEIPRSGIVTALTAVAFFGVATLEPEIGNNYAWVDGPILLLGLIAIMGMRVRGGFATATALRASPWIWLIMLGSVAGLIGVGIPSWAASSLVRTAIAIGAFFCFLHLLDLRHVERAAIVGTAVALTFSAFHSLVIDNDTRAGALFPHANYAGHFGALAGVVLFHVSNRWWWKLASLAGIGVMLYTSASFGAMAMVLAALAVPLTRSVARNSGLLAIVLVISGGISMLVLLTTTDVGVDTEDAAVSETISQERFERSQEGRLELWGQAWAAFVESPTGVGPDGVKNRGVGDHKGRNKEIHADALGYLVERGIPGLIGYVGLWAVLWKAAPRGGLARVLVVMLVTAGLFRETMHYRHGWLLLALAFVLDLRRVRGTPGPSGSEVEPPPARPALA